MVNGLEPPITRVDIDQARRANATLLKQGAWCKIHQRGYAANHMVGARIEGQGCPRCAAEIAWVRKARAALDAEAVEITGKVLLKRAEQMAGQRLYRYKRYE